MKLRDHFEGRGDPFEGDRTIVWRSLPANALVTKATLTVEPRLPPQSSAYIETLSFAGGGAYGATIRAVAAETAEIDFHARRTPVSFTGLTPTTSTTTPAALSVDIGGNVYLSVSANGTIPHTTGAAYNPSSSTLPGIGASRIRLANFTNAKPDKPEMLESVTVDIATMPSNVTLRFGKRLPFWFKTGDLASPATTPDIIDAVKLAIADAPVVNGFYAIPLVVHSDTLGRLAITLEVEYFGVAPLLPAGLREVVLAYDHATTAKQDASALQAILPAGASIVPELTSLQLRGAFEESRIAYGPTGTTTTSDTVRCSASATLAQPIVPSLDINVTAIDLFVAAERPAARLALDLRADFDGKPSQNSLLAKPVPFDLEGDATGQLRWISVPLDPPALLRAIPPKPKPNEPKRYWVVVQAIDGEAILGIDADTPERREMTWGTNSRQSRPPLLVPEKRPQHSTNSGFSWRDAPPILLRMRTVPGRFTMPIEFAAGGDLHRASLDRYDPLGKIDAVVNEPAIAAAVQTAVLDVTRPSCPRGELLENGDFALWRRIGDTLGNASPVSLNSTVAAQPSSIVVADTFFNKAVIRPLQSSFPPPANLVFSSDGASIYAATTTGIYAIDAVDLAVRRLDDEITFNAVDVAADPLSATLYRLSSSRLEAFDPVADAPSGNSLTFTGARVLALAGDGRKAYVATFETFSAIIAVDFVTGMQGWRIAASAEALALTPDGATIFAMNSGARQITCYDTASGAMRWSIVLPDGRVPHAIAAAVDGSGVYVAGAVPPPTGILPPVPASFDLLVLDMRGRVAQSVALRTMAGQHIGLAVKPQGDQLYVADAPIAIDPAGQHLVAITPVRVIVAVPIGARQPVAWTLTAGSVAPHASSDEPPKIDGAAIRNGALSQVIAVAPGCIHDFIVEATVSSSEGVALSTVEAFAELFWLDAAGALLDSVELPLPPSSRIVRQRRRIQSPSASAQAEVRIRVGDGICLVQSVSLQAADGAIAQDAWRAEANPQAIRISGRDSITTYQNLGAAEVALAQTVMLTKSMPYEMDFRGSTSGNPAAAPYFELRYWDANGVSLGDAARIALDPLGFSRRLAALLPPEAATSAQIRMVLPPGASISAESVQLVPRPVTAVPCTFIAQSPGEIHVSNAQIVYEWQPGPRPAPPAGGLNPPTPPGSTPGDASCCDPCGETDAAAADLRAVAAFSVLSANVSPAGMLAAVMRTEFDAPLTSIIGIAAARERRLNDAGILTLRDLAAATPAQVVKALEGTVAPTPELAIILIGRARTALGMQPDEHP